MNSSRRWLTVAAFIAVTIVLGVIAFNQVTDKADQSEQKASDTAAAAVPLADQVTAACEGGGDAAAELRARGLCVQASDTKKAIKKADVEPTPAPTQYLPPDPVQLASLVRDSVFTNCGGSCKGDDGRDATFAQVLKAVTQTLPQALLQACGGSCKSDQPGVKGDTGSTGPAGPVGPAGRGIKAMHCDATNRISVEYTDGTTDVIDGSRCRGVDLPVAP